MPLKALTITAALGAACGIAQAGEFAGPFVQSSIGFANAQSKLSFPDWLDLRVADSSLVGEAAIGYSFAFADFNLAVSGQCVIGDQKAGGFTDHGFRTAVQVKLRNTWGVSIEPGLQLNDATLVYVTLGYNWTKASFMENDTLGIFSLEQRLTGTSIGVGIKHRFSPRIYAVSALRNTIFQSGTLDFGGSYPRASIKPSALTGTVGVGFRF
ncbi:MAG: outer membrane beta-barrel protein [Holophagaceae bacterium]